MTASAVREPALGVRAEGWGWRHAGRSAPALQDVTLTVSPGERVLLAGPSGGGKSTFLAACAGLLDADAGVSSGSLHVGSDVRRPGRVAAGLLVQDPASQILMSRVADDVAFGPENLAVARHEIDERIRTSLHDVHLDVAWRHDTAALSGGQTQRLALAGLLAMRPGLLLLDEPTSSLDPDGMRHAMSQIEDVATTTGCTLIMVEHRIDLVLAMDTFVDRVIVMDGQRGVIADVVREDLRSHAAVVDLGLWLPEHRVKRRAHSAQIASEPLIAAEGVTVRHPEGASPAVVDATLTVFPGEVVAIAGPNGSGKTTLALALAGLLPRESGYITTADALARNADPDPVRWTPRQLAARIGVVFQNPEHQFVTAHVRYEVALGPTLLGKTSGEVAARVEEILTRMRLNHLSDANPFTLSGGEQRRLSVATALASAPPVLILDEPTFGQDLRTWTELVDLMAEVRDAGTAIVMVTHDEPLITALANRVVRMHEGRVLA